MKWYGWLFTILGIGAAGYGGYYLYKKSKEDNLGTTPPTGSLPKVSDVTYDAPTASRGAASKAAKGADQLLIEQAQEQGESPGMLGSIWNSWSGMF